MTRGLVAQSPGAPQHCFACRLGTYSTGLALVALIFATAFCVAGDALGDIDVPFVWQVWLLVTSTRLLCGSCGSYSAGRALVACLVTWSPLVASGAAALCVAGLALGDIDVPFVW